MDQDFYDWSIPNYFIQNYDCPSFHLGCQSKDSQTPIQHFIDHFIQYLIKWLPIRGKWIYSFTLNDKQISHLSEWSPDTKKQHLIDRQSKAFINMLKSISYSYEHLLLIAFIGKFFNILQSGAACSQINELLQQIRQLYFLYRVQMSFITNVDVGELPIIVNFLSKILSIPQIKMILDSSCGQSSLLSHIVQLCELENIMRKIFKMHQQAQNNTESMKMNNKSVFQSNLPKQANLSPLIKQNFNKIYTPEKVTANDFIYKINIDEQQAQQVSKGVKKALQKKKNKGLETYNKVIKTTRHSNFKGVFTKKIENLSYHKMFESKKELHQSKTKQIISQSIFLQYRNINYPEEPSQHDFLCDKSS